MRRFTHSLLATAFIALTCQLGALTVNPIDDRLVSVEVATRSETRATALRDAERDAVIAAAGRVLLDERLIRAESLLKRYLDVHFEQFILGREILVDRFRGGFNEIEARIFVDFAALAQNLDEKRFLFTPAFRPLFTAFIDERIDGQVIDQMVAQPLIANALLQQGLRPHTGQMPEALLRQNVLASETVTATAVEASERRGIELFFSGTARTNLQEQRDVYFDTFFFYDSEITVEAFRVDSGERLATLTARGSGSDRNRAEAARLAIERATDSIALQFVDIYGDVWPAVRGAEDFEILLTGASPETVRVFGEYMRQLGSNTRVSVRRFFGPSVLLSVRTDASREDVMQAIRASPFPALNIVGDDGRRRFEVQVSS